MRLNILTMIFTGDFLFPSRFSENIFKGLGEEFLQKPKILNFESTLQSINQKKQTNGIALYSSDESLNALKYLNVTCTSHANNHMKDFEFDWNTFEGLFHQAGIKTIGFGKNIQDASVPFKFENENLIVLSFGWETIGCRASGVKKSGVNPLRYRWIETKVKEYLTKYPNYHLILFLHWNYEFEQYPSPADRQFSLKMIDLGISGIFGHHPHIINGYEVYKNKPIFYSLGNFYVPQVKYENHQLNYSDNALDGISVEYNGNIDQLKIYHHTQDKKGNELQLLGEYKRGEFDSLEKLSQFQGMSHQDYICYYKKHRFHRKKLLPVYKNYNSHMQNKLFDTFVKLRQIPVDSFGKIK